MAKKLSWGILLLVLILSLVMTSCSIMSNLTSSNTPSGTYTATEMGLKQTATFEGNKTLEIYDVLDGKMVYTYSISADGQSLTFTNIVTNETGTESYQYIKAQNCVVLGGLAYYK